MNFDVSAQTPKSRPPTPHQLLGNDVIIWLIFHDLLIQLFGTILMTLSYVVQTLKANKAAAAAPVVAAEIVSIGGALASK